jgi:hypothetical protein
MISERRFPRPESDEKTPRGASLLSMYVPNPRDASLMHNQIHPCLMILKLSLVSPTGLPQVPGEQTGVVRLNDALLTFWILELEIADHGSGDGDKLHVGKLFSDTPMSSSTKR